MNINDLNDDATYAVIVDLPTGQSGWTRGYDLKRFWRDSRAQRFIEAVRTLVPDGYIEVSCPEDQCILLAKEIHGITCQAATITIPLSILHDTCVMAAREIVQLFNHVTK